MTSVRALPFNDSNVKIDVEGRQIIFGFEASPGGAVRPEFTPDGGVWPTGSSNDGWSEANKRYPEVVSALVYANKMEAALNAAPKTYRLEVSPEIAAHMRACGVYDMTAVLRHTERTTAQDGLVYVEIPLNTTLMAEIVKPWHDAGVKYLRVSQQFVGIKLVDIFSADGI